MFKMFKTENKIEKLYSLLDLELLCEQGAAKTLILEDTDQLNDLEVLRHNFKFIAILKFIYCTNTHRIRRTELFCISQSDKNRSLETSSLRFTLLQ